MIDSEHTRTCHRPKPELDQHITIEQPLSAPKLVFVKAIILLDVSDYDLTVASDRWGTDFYNEFCYWQP